MHALEFEEISATHFQSFQEVTLPIRKGKHLVLGANGSGKSTLFEIMDYACFKHTLREKNPSTDGQGHCKTSVKFKRDQEHYRIDRYLGDTQYGNKVKLYRNNEDQSTRKISSTEEEVLKVLGMSEKIFNSIVLISQGLPINFTQLTPTARKALIEEYLGFSSWNLLRPQLSSRIKNLSENGHALSDSSGEKLRKKLDLVQKIQVLQAIEGNENENYQNQVLELEAKLKGVEDTLAQLLGDRKALSSSSLTQLYPVTERYKSALTQITHRVRILNTFIEKKICSECEQAYPEAKVQAAQKELQFLSTKIKSLQNAIGLQNQLIESIVSTESKISMQYSSQNDFRQQLNHLHDSQKKQNPRQDTFVLESALKELSDQIEVLSQEMAQVEQSLENVRYLDGLLLPSSPFRTQVLENYLEYINSILDSVCPHIFDQMKVKLVIEPKNNGIEFELSKRSYAGLSGGQKRRLDLICILSFQKFVIEKSGISTNLLVFDEIFDNIDAAGVNTILSSLDVLFPEDSCIYVMSHNRDIQSHFSSLITVTQENGVSQLDLSAYQ